MRAKLLFPLLLTLAFPVSAGALAAPASLEDIILLAESGVSDETIRVFLSSRPVNFDLDADAIAQLKGAGISEETIQTLLDSVAEPASETDTDVLVVVAADPYPYHYYGSYYLAGAHLHLERVFPRWGFHFSFPFPFPVPVPHLSHVRHRVLPHDYTSHHLHRYSGHRAKPNSRQSLHAESRQHRVGKSDHKGRKHASGGYAGKNHDRGRKHASHGYAGKSHDRGRKHASHGYAGKSHDRGRKHASGGYAGKSGHKRGRHRGHR